MTITLYNLHRSPPCGFIRSLAKHLGIELDLKNLDFTKKEHFGEDYLKINPFHKVPAIDDDGFVVYESTAIAYYLIRKYATESDLYPACVETRTRIDQILACASGTIHNHSAVFFRPRVWCKNKPTAEEVRTFEENVIQGLEHLIGDGKFAVGDKLTLADLAIFAHLTLAIENDSVDKSKFPKLANYHERVKNELPYLEEIHRPAIEYFKHLWAELK
ncbi:glutathione S-transferase 4 [Rhipicephalus sanguineus]|uniref:glutathione S-transferase 4 n=1 Tax=Rhipicephalus sanguineus TaxID=34632 RepID=UPI0018931EA2|nr:glutathione S-transferase 4 [Rhipicephalus sanguineus]